MATKQEMIEELKLKGVAADETMHPMTLTKMLKEANGDTTAAPVETATLTPLAPVAIPSNEKEGYMKITDVKALIAEALAQQAAESKQPIKLKKVTEHTAHVWRLDGKWVVDFKDRNTDPYIKEKIFSYQKFNAELREFQAWIEVVFEDGTTKDLPLNTYVKNRTAIYCPIIKRHQVDKSYSIGEVEKKKEQGDKLVPTGVVVDQEVTMYEEVFEVKTPTGALNIPAYAIA